MTTSDGGHHGLKRALVLRSKWVPLKVPTDLSGVA